MEGTTDHTDAAPSAERAPDGPASGERCKCGAVRHGTDPHRCARGHGWDRNPLALRTGRYSQQVARAALPGQAEIRALLAGREAALIVDLGGADAVGTIKGDIAREYQRLYVIAEHLGDHVMTAGAVTGKGKKRAAVDAYLSVLDRMLRIANLLGLERRPKDANLDDWLHGGDRDDDSSTTTPTHDGSTDHAHEED